MKIRKATILDVHEIIEMGLHSLEWVWPGKPVDKGHIAEMVINLIHNGVIFVAENDDEIFGMIGGMITPSIWYPQDICLIELFWWVEPGHRCSSAGLRLLKAYEKFGKNHKDVNIITMAMESISPLNADAYIKRGYKLKENVFYMEVE